MKHKYVYWDEKYQKYQVKIKKKFHGYFLDLESAIKKRNEVLEEPLKQFAK